MPQEVKFPIKVDGTDELNRLVSALKNVQQAAANANAVSNNQSAAAVHGKMMAAAQKANVRTQAAAMSVQGVYGAGGSNQYSGYKPSGGGGGAGGSAVGMGAMAGMAAAGVLLLVKALKDALAQSKIANAFLGTLSKLLGLLIDVVLLPFLPLLIGVLLVLTTGIMTLYKVMSKLTPSSLTSGSATTAATTTPINDVGQAVIGPVGFDIGRWIGEHYTDSIIQSVMDGGTKLVDAAKLTWAQWSGAFDLTWTQWSKTFDDDWNAITDWINTNVIVPIENLWKGIVDWFDTNVTTPIKNLWDKIMDSLTGWFTNLYNNPLIKWLSSMIGSSSTATSTSSSGQTGGLDIGLPTSSKSTTSSNTFNIVGAASADANTIINFIQSALFRAGSQSPGQGSNG
jgi:hypothetical protein